jgi:hypothetical protein
MLTQAQADRLIAELKQASSDTVFVWESEQRQDETFVAASDAKLQFVLTLSRNPFEIKIHARTRDRSIPLLRIDNAPFHVNPDGSELRDTPHLHSYREGCDLAWAEPIDWYDVTDPLRTLERFLKEFSARFPSGITVAMV